MRRSEYVESSVVVAAMMSPECGIPMGNVAGDSPYEAALKKRREREHSSCGHLPSTDRKSVV